MLKPEERNEGPSFADWLVAELRCATFEVQRQHPIRNLVHSCGQIRERDLDRRRRGIKL